MSQHKPRYNYHPRQQELGFAQMFKEMTGQVQILRFYMYSEMGIIAPTLYGTMMTQEQADSMWANTKTEYWAVPGLGFCVRNVDAAPIDTTPSGEVK